MQEVVAKALRQSGRSRLILGDSRGRDDYRRAIQVYEELAARFPERIWLRTGLIETLREYASLLAEPIDSTEADGSIRRAVEVADTLIGNQSAALPCFRKALVGPFSGLAWNFVSQAPLRPGDVAQADTDRPASRRLGCRPARLLAFAGHLLLSRRRLEVGCDLVSDERWIWTKAETPPIGS